MEKRYLILENGAVFEGEGFGADAEALGELVFTTAMTGAAESLTDPSYRGQLLLFTFPQLGNYGISREDLQSSRVWASAVVTRALCVQPSNFRADWSVDAFLRENGVPGLMGVDTRAIAQTIREAGVMNALLTDTPPSGVPQAVRDYRVRNAVAAVSVKSPVQLPAQGETKYRVALLDYGTKVAIPRALTRRGCRVTLFPHDTPAEAILSGGFDGVMLANGPGDPAENVAAIRQLTLLLGKLPIFGVCLGHQLLALAAGARTEKMKFGHRGANQPVRDLTTGRVVITSQNHGYAVREESLAGTPAVLRWRNLNDGTCEGLEYPGLQAFSTQFHPEAHGGPLDSTTVFDRFLAMMGGNDHAER